MGKINTTRHGYTYSSVKKYVHLIDEFKNERDYVVLDKSIIPKGAYGYFGIGKSHFSGSRLAKEKAPKGTDSFFRYTVSKERLKEIKFYSRYATNKDSFIGFTRKSYKPAMEEVLGQVEVLKLTGKYMVWRSRILPAQ